MMTFAMLTRVSPEALHGPRSLEDLEKQTVERIRTECPEVSWIANYAALGPWDYLDLFEAPDVDVATKVSTLVRTCGHAHTEIWPLTEWKRFKGLVDDLASSEQ